MGACPPCRAAGWGLAVGPAAAAAVAGWGWGTSPRAGWARAGPVSGGGSGPCLLTHSQTSLVTFPWVKLLKSEMTEKQAGVQGLLRPWSGAGGGRRKMNVSIFKANLEASPEQKLHNCSSFKFFLLP